MDENECRALVALSLVPGLGPGRIRRLVNDIGSARETLHSASWVLEGTSGIGEQTARSIVAFDRWDLVDAQFEAAGRIGARLLTERSEEYPPLLRHIYDPPPFLWIRGRYESDDEVSIAIVGTRRATSYGRHVSRKLASELAVRGFTIVSGLAYGIDASAHLGALDATGRSIGILGSGIDRIYPSANTGLARRLIESGCLLSEYELGAAPDAPNFPRRNRIISGMTLGTIVVEAFEEGGAHITARLACEQNREVFAVPSPISNRGGAGSGSNRLIQRGHAKLVMSIEDVLAEFPTIVTGDSVSEPSEEDEPEGLTDTERLLWAALEYQPAHLDAICSKCELEPSTALVHLLNLEFRGLVRQMAGKQFVRN